VTGLALPEPAEQVVDALAREPGLAGDHGQGRALSPPLDDEPVPFGPERFELVCDGFQPASRVLLGRHQPPRGQPAHLPTTRPGWRQDRALAAGRGCRCGAGGVGAGVWRARIGCSASAGAAGRRQTARPCRRRRSEALCGSWRLPGPLRHLGVALTAEQRQLGG